MYLREGQVELRERERQLLRLQPLSQNGFFRSDLYQLTDVEGGYAKCLGEAELAVRLGVRVTLGSETHVLAFEDPHTFAAFDALTVEDNLRDDDGLLRVDFLLTRWTFLVSQGTLHSLPLLSLLLLLSRKSNSITFNFYLILNFKQKTFN